MSVLEQVFRISENDDLPKYQQIISSVLDGIEQGCIGKGTRLPSINEVCKRHSFARETVVKAYRQLKEKGVVASQHGKGFYVTTNSYTKKMNVFFLFDVLANAYKEKLHDGIKEGLQGKAAIDFCFHHFNPSVFCKLLRDSFGKYEYYVVMPFPNDAVRGVLSKFDQNKLLLLDIDVDYPGKACSVVRQNHDEEFIRAMESGIDRIKHYKSLTFVFPNDKNHPIVAEDAFTRFCEQHDIEGRIVRSLDGVDIEKGHAYLLIEDDDLVRLVKHTRANRWQVGRDIGLISYNDTPLKEIIEGGVTAVSIDFHEMGLKTAEHILSRQKVNVLQPTKLILRNSL